MEFSGRHFIKKSAVGVTGALIAKSTFAQTDNSTSNHGNMLFGFFAENSVLDEAKKNIPKVRQRDALVQFLNKSGESLKNMVD